jgi:predicted DNA-binding protein (UPF0251 family)
MEWTSSKLRGLAEQVLTEQEHRVYRFHLLLGADQKLCCRKMNLGLDEFRQTLASLQQKLSDAAQSQRAQVISMDDFVATGAVRPIEFPTRKAA